MNAKRIKIKCIVACFIIALVMLGCSNTPTARKPIADTGSTVTIQIASNGKVLMAKTYALHNTMDKYIMAGDTIGIQNMVLAGDAFAVSSGAQALVITKRLTKCEVRIQSGTNAGASGWVSSQYVKAI